MKKAPSTTPSVSGFMTLAILTATIAIWAPTASANDLQFAHLHTNGVAKISVAADIAEINVSVINIAATSTKAKSAVDKAVTAFIVRLKKAGVNENDIKSANIQLQPHYTYDSKTRSNNQTGFKARRQLIVTVKNLDKLNSLLDFALKQGINRIDSLTFKSSKEKKVMAQARQMAIKDSQQKAAALAQGFGEKLGRVWEILDLSQSSVRPVGYRLNSSRQANTDDTYRQRQVTITSSIEVTYRLK